MAENIKHFVRIRNTDLLGSKQILMALQKIHGVGFNFANAICYATKIPPTKITGTLSDEEIQQLIVAPFMSLKSAVESMTSEAAIYRKIPDTPAKRYGKKDSKAFPAK